MNDLLVSIIVPVYNTSSYLSDCINSLLHQTYINIEVILIDDGSSDGSEKICDYYKAKDKRIIVVHKKNGGVSSARNIGLSLAKGSYLCFVDSDDILDISFVETMYNCIKLNNVYMAACGFAQFGANKKGIKYPLYKEKRYVWQDYISIFTGSVCNKMFKREIFNDIKFNEKLLIGEDSSLIPTLIVKAKYIFCCSKFLYLYRQRETSATHVFFNNYYESILMFDRLSFFYSKGLGMAKVNKYFRNYFLFYIKLKHKKNDNIELENKADEKFKKSLDLFYEKMSLYNKAIVSFPNLYFYCRKLVKCVLYPVVITRRFFKKINFIIKK